MNDVYRSASRFFLSQHSGLHDGKQDLAHGGGHIVGCGGIIMGAGGGMNIGCGGGIIIGGGGSPGQQVGAHDG